MSVTPFYIKHPASVNANQQKIQEWLPEAEEKGKTGRRAPEQGFFGDDAQYG